MQRRTNRPSGFPHSESFSHCGQSRLESRMDFLPQIFTQLNGPGREESLDGLNYLLQYYSTTPPLCFWAKSSRVARAPRGRESAWRHRHLQTNTVKRPGERQLSCGPMTHCIVLIAVHHLDAQYLLGGGVHGQCLKTVQRGVMKVGACCDFCGGVGDGCQG